MINPDEQPINTPESVVSLPWVITDPDKVSELRYSAEGLKVGLPIMKALRGGRMLSPQEGILTDADREYVAQDRSIAVIPADQNISGYESVIYFPTTIERSRFDANLAAYRKFAHLVAARWKSDELAPSPIPPTKATNVLADGRYVTVTEYRDRIEGLGKGLATGIHELDTKKLPLIEIPRLLKVLDAIHVPSNDFLKWLQGSKIRIHIPPESWLASGNEKCALRGQEWWVNSDSQQDDRLKELQRAAGAQSVTGIYSEVFPENNFPALLEEMVRNNLALYPHQDGTVDDSKLAGELVVVHGTLSPGNIHRKLDPETGTAQYTITGGDRSQLYGHRGQMIDWLVSSCASSPDHQKALIDEFIKLHPDEKERRGLAMHVMYRSIMEAPWFAGQGKEAEARNLIQLANNILNAKDVWVGVNTPLTK